MQTINEFLELFYKSISFECGEEFKSSAFRELFYPFAVLVESNNSVYKHKSIEQHIKEFENVIKEYPQLFISGFHEVQIECEILQNDKYFLVSSTYKKTYSREQKDVIEYGKNNMTIINDNGQFKIVSITW